MSIDLDQLIRGANKLEPLPASAMRLTGLLAEQDWDIAEIVRVIELDPALTARLLRVANSAAAGSSRSITTAREAVLRLGAATVAAIAMGFGVRHIMLRALPEHASREDALWRHSVASALAVQCMTRHCKISPPPEAFTAALLHDVGKLLLCQTLSANVIELMRSARESGRSEIEAEWEVLEVTHPELGGLIAQHWRLPQAIITGISLHHAPLASVRREHTAACRAVQLSDWVAKSVGAGLDPALPSPGETEPVRTALAISEEQYGALCTEVASRLETTLAQYAEKL